MKRIMFLGLFVLGSSLMSFSSSSKEQKMVFKMYLVNHVCENGHTFSYWRGVPGYTEADYQDMINAACN